MGIYPMAHDWLEEVQIVVVKEAYLLKSVPQTSGSQEETFRI